MRISAALPFMALGMSCAGAGLAHAADLAAPPVVAAATASAWTVQLNSEVRYFSWTGQLGDPGVTPAGTFSRGGKGSEVYTPTTLSVSGLAGESWRIEALIRSGYVAAHQATTGVTGTVGTFTDTVPSLTLTYLGLNGIQPFAALSLNVPTGQTSLLATSSNARMDADLVDVPTFGEGFNIGPTIGANIPINETVLSTVSAAYTARGNFRQDGVFIPGVAPQATNRIHPGDLFTVTGSITAQVEAWTYQLSVNYVRSSKVQTNDVDQIQSGQQISISPIIGYAFNENYSIRAIGSFAYTLRNRAPGPPLGQLASEANDSNSALLSMRLEPTYRRDRFSIGPVGAIQYRSVNAYDNTALEYVPAKTRVAAGAQGSYALTDKASINARAEHISTHVGASSLVTGLPGVSRDAWLAVLGGTYTF